MVESASTADVLPEVLRPSGALYGRDGELARIAAAWERARAGVGQVVFVEAPAGEGKSALIAHAAADAVGAPGARVLCGAAHRNSYLSFEPFTLAINQWCTRAEIGELGVGVAGVGSNLKSLCPVLWERIPDLADPPPGDLAGLRMRIVGAVSGFVQNLTGLGPVLCVLDDLHWADDDTVGLLGDLVAACQQWPMLVLATMRPGEISAALRAVRALLAGRVGFESITLGPLRFEVIGSIIAEAVGQTPAADVVAEIQRVTGGNALWIGEVARKLLEAGGGGGRLQAGFSQQLPGTLTETIKLRLHDLDPSMTSLMAQASVLGATIDPVLLADVVGMPAGQVLEGLRVAERRHLMYSPDAAGCFRFAHPLIESTLYDGLDQVRLKRSHRRAGLALEKKAGAQALSHAPELAHHFTHAGPSYAPQAYLYSAIAGKAALEIAAYERALRHLHTALSLSHTVEESQRQVHEFQLTMGQGLATMSLRGLNHPETVAVFSRVAELTEALPPSPELLPGLAGLWAMEIMRMNLPGARDYEKKLLAIGELLPPGTDRLAGPLACLIDVTYENAFDAADMWGRRCQAIIDDPDFVDTQYLYPGDADPVSLSYLEWALALNTRAADPDKARAVFELGKASISRAFEPRQAFSYNTAATVHWIRREADQVAQAAANSVDICDRLKILQWSIWGNAFLGWAQAIHGDRDGAARCREAVDMWHAEGSNLGSNLLAALVAEACIAAGQPQPAQRFIERALQLYPITGQMFHVPSLIRAKAELAVLDRSVGDPETLYRQAISLAQHQDARALALQAALSMTQWNLDLGHELLAAALNRIGPDVDLPDVKAARSLLGT